MNRIDLVRELASKPRHPEKEFTISDCSYARVYEMAAGFRNFFRVSGRHGEDVVCLCTQNKAVIAAAILASLGCGPVMLLPHALSRHALLEMHELTGFRTAIADGGHDLPAGVEEVSIQYAESEDCPAIQDLHPSRELIRLYTGGSTGAPKIWTKTVQNLFFEACYLAERYSISEKDRFVATVSPCHIYGLLFSVIVPFVSSASVFNGSPSFPDEIRQTVEQNEATVFVSVPAHYHALKGKRMSRARLRLAFSSAGMLAEEDNHEFHRLHQVDVIEVFGSTESGGIAARNRARGEAAFTPFQAVDWEIRDERLLVRSGFLSPEAPLTGEGYFITGDRVAPHGETGFLPMGRSTSIVKVGGKRVDLDEVRDKIMAVPAVKNCLVISIPVQGGRENQIAALVTGMVDKAQLKKEISSHLEPYAMPRVISIVEDIPVNENGKYDMAALMSILKNEHPV